MVTVLSDVSASFGSDSLRPSREQQQPAGRQTRTRAGRHDTTRRECNSTPTPHHRAAHRAANLFTRLYPVPPPPPLSLPAMSDEEWGDDAAMNDDDGDWGDDTGKKGDDEGEW